MAPIAQDRIDVHDLIDMHGHLVDAGRLDEACELPTPDVVHDMSDLGPGPLHGAAAVRKAALALGDANPVGRHVTDIVVTEVDDHSARARSKGLGIMADGTCGSVVYEDVVQRRTDGWRTSRRTVTGRRAALGGRGAGTRS